MTILNRWLVLILFFVCAGCERSENVASEDSAKLFEAIREKDVEEVRAIVASGTVDLDPPRLPNQNNKALVYAAGMGNLEIVKIILGAGVDINGPGAYGDVPLIKAAEHGNHDILRYLIDSGADVNKPNAFGVSPFIGLCAGDDVDLVRRCIEKGGKINESYVQQTDSGKGQRNSTALQMAVLYGRAEVVKLLLANGGDPDLRNGSGLTCLEQAREKNFPEVVKILEDAKKGQQ